jgi:hypothetical protein
LSTIVLYNILQFRSVREFCGAAAGIAILSLVTFFKTNHLNYFLRNSLWFLFIAAGVFITHLVLNHRYFRRTSFVSLTIWMLCCASYYLLMTLLNLFAFRFYPLEYATRFLLRSAALGFSMGLGIGIGYEIFRRYGRWLAAQIFTEPDEDDAEE